MIKINCEAEKKISITSCVPFQGNLKKRNQQDIDDLKKSLIEDGLMMPFVIWKHDDKNYILDGHGRREALIQLSFEDNSILLNEYPCIYIDAETEDDARKALLQITSSYGKITKLGAKQFTASIPNYIAPCIKKFVATPKKVETPVIVEPKRDNKKIIKLRIDEDKFEKFLDILRQFDYIEIL